VTGSSGMVRKRAHLRAAPGHDIEVLEKDTETSWAAFQALNTAHEQGFKATEPATLHNLPPAPAAAIPGVEDVMAEARRNNRVCPKPLVWQRLYEWLPHKGPKLPGVPATRAEWEQLSALQKRSRLREHIEWAAFQGVLPKVHEALKALPEDRWHHMGD
jgi:hypothetical protein